MCHASEPPASRQVSCFQIVRCSIHLCTATGSRHPLWPMTAPQDKISLRNKVYTSWSSPIFMQRAPNEVILFQLHHPFVIHAPRASVALHGSGGYQFIELLCSTQWPGFFAVQKFYQRTSAHDQVFVRQTFRPASFISTYPISKFAQQFDSQHEAGLIILCSRAGLSSHHSHHAPSSILPLPSCSPRAPLHPRSTRTPHHCHHPITSPLRNNSTNTHLDHHVHVESDGHDVHHRTIYPRKTHSRRAHCFRRPRRSSTLSIRSRSSSSMRLVV